MRKVPRVTRGWLSRFSRGDRLRAMQRFGVDGNTSGSAAAARERWPTLARPGEGGRAGRVAEWINGPASGRRVRTFHLRADLGLVREGLRLALEYGVGPLEEMVRVAELIESSVYDHGSLATDGRQVRFRLLNPPLRMGAFSRVALHWDGAVIAPANATIAPADGRPPRRFDEVSPERPTTIPTGRRTEIAFQTDRQESGVHRVRLELDSVAIPPMVWLEFTDRLATSMSP